MNTPNLQLPEIPEAILGASDELNQGFWSIDALLQLAVIDRTHTLATLPASAAQGDRYLIASGPRAGHIAYRSPTGWLYFVPRPGWVVWSIAEATMLYFASGQGWAAFARNRQTIRGTWVRAGAAIELPVTYIPHYFTSAKTLVGLSVLTVGGPGDCVIDIRKGAVGEYPSGVSMCGDRKPTITAGHTLVDNDLGNWLTTELAAGEFLLMILEASSTFTYIGLQIEVAESA